MHNQETGVFGADQVVLSSPNRFSLARFHREADFQPGRAAPRPAPTTGLALQGKPKPHELVSQQTKENLLPVQHAGQ
jgi:hypothetical protein